MRSFFLVITAFCLLAGCSGSSVFVPSPKTVSTVHDTVAVEKSKENEPAPLQKPATEDTGASGEDALDFALAFADTVRMETPEPAQPPLSPLHTTDKIPSAEPGKSVFVPCRMVRVALFQNISRIFMYSLDTVEIRHRFRQQDELCRGRISITAGKMKGEIPGVVLEVSGTKKFTAFLPCTLLARSGQNYFELGEHSYRGSIILADGKDGSFSVVNYCTVEEYLRGVVPLEIGKRPDSDIEAIKAQAVAARTYTYKKIVQNRARPFDLVATIEDQVYGGVNAENPVSDRAIQMTENRVMVYGDSLIYAYYHSTCGGVTANIDEVWNKQPLPYLKQIRDVGADGRAFCSISNQFTWKETWQTQALSSIAQRYSRGESSKTGPVKGMITRITVKDRYRCGRVSTCRIAAGGAAYEYTGDRIRFVLRRNSAGHPILRSLYFEVLEVNAKYVKLSGRGYGHGIGMCQMGALGRARAGQTFEEILRAYYSGIAIVAIISPK